MSHRPQICHPDWSDPGSRRGGTCSFTFGHKRMCRGQVASGYARVGMTNLKAVAHLGMDGGGWTEHTAIATNLIWLARVLFNAFSKLRRPEDHCSANLDSSKARLHSSNSLLPGGRLPGTSERLFS
jgi:hypothetical protein